MGPMMQTGFEDGSRIAPRNIAFLAASRVNDLRPGTTWLFRCCAVLFCVAALVGTATAQSLRVVTYNIDADTGGADGSMGGVYAGPGLSTVLQGIGNAKLAGNAQPI